MGSAREVGGEGVRIGVILDVHHAQVRHADGDAALGILLLAAAVLLGLRDTTQCS